jgi:hypothetical protein
VTPHCCKLKKSGVPRHQPVSRITPINDPDENFLDAERNGLLKLLQLRKSLIDASVSFIRSISTSCLETSSKKRARTFHSSNNPGDDYFNPRRQNALRH